MRAARDAWFTARRLSSPRSVLFFTASVLLSCVGGSACRRSTIGPLVRCTLKYEVTTRQVEIRPAREPYEVASVPVGERFSFKGVLRTEPKGSLNLYVYDREREPSRELVLQEVKYVAPFPGSRADAEFGFTGHQYVYSPSGREFEYWCAWSWR